jgi:hypothetical protein
MYFFKNRLVAQASQIRLLRSLWHMLPYKARLSIFQRLSLTAGNSIEKLTEVLIDILENEPLLASGIEKKDEVLKFLKKNKLAAMSPEFPEIWLQKDPGTEPFFNFNGAFFPYLSGEAAETFALVFFDTFCSVCFLTMIILPRWLSGLKV